MPDSEKIVETKDRRLKLRDTVFMKCLFSLLPRPVVQVNHLGCILLKYFYNTRTNAFTIHSCGRPNTRSFIFEVERKVSRMERWFRG